MVKRDIQSQNQETKVKVGVGYDYQSNQVTTDIITADRKYGGHQHDVFDAWGNCIESHWKLGEAKKKSK